MIIASVITVIVIFIVCLATAASNGAEIWIETIELAWDESPIFLYGGPRPQSFLFFSSHPLSLFWRGRERGNWIEREVKEWVSEPTVLCSNMKKGIRSETMRLCWPDPGTRFRDLHFFLSLNEKQWRQRVPNFATVKPLTRVFYDGVKQASTIHQNIPNVLLSS